MSIPSVVHADGVGQQAFWAQRAEVQAADENGEEEDEETTFVGEDPMPEIPDSSLPEAEVRPSY